MAQYPMMRIGVTAPFDFYTVNGKRTMHFAIDICSQQNTNVQACHGGRVIGSFFDGAGGNMLVLQGYYNEQCDILTRYAHLACRKVSVGQDVFEGQLIGIQGATGSACFGQHLHLETWLVPKNYTYRFADREKYAIDPLSILHLLSGQVFVKDKDTFFAEGLPYPEPSVDGLCRIDGAKLKVDDGSIRLRVFPSTQYMHMVAGAGRSLQTLADFTDKREFDALYKCSTGSEKTVNEWVMIMTEYGSLWVAVLPKVTKLYEVEKEEPPIMSDEQQSKEAEKRIAELVLMNEKYRAAIEQISQISKSVG
ncbi:MAG: M23 family metallopeptidase [Oscillospiraceae bacterium]